MVLWFERTLEFLMICKDKSSTISALVDDFYDTALVICECNSENGVKQLLETFLFTLGFITMKKWPPHHVRLEAMKTFNFIIDKSSREEKKRLNSSEEMCTLMQGLARELFEVGDYDIQVTITEALCRMTTKKIRDNFAQKWFEDSFFAEAFKEINDKDFETDCRKFLNSFNSRIEDAVRVHTFPCLSVSTDVGELTKPQDEKLEHFWIDFNVGSQSISFYIQKNKGCHWEPVRLQKELLIGYSFEECNGQKFLSVHLKIPQSINNKLVKYIKMSFELEHDIQNATIKTYGEDLQMKVHHTSPQQTEKLNNLQDVMTDSRERVSSGDQEFTSFANDTPRVLEFPEEEKFPKISGKSSTSALSETKGNSPKQQSAEKRAFDVYEFPQSSDSSSDVEESAVKEKVLSPVITPNSQLRTPYSQKTEAKKAVDHKDSSESEKSWILEYRREPSAKSADYSRKKRKSKLKVLPLSSQSSSEEKQHNKKLKGQPSKFTEIKIVPKQRGAAESLSFSELKLPGISGLLTPRHSHPQISGTLHLSDLDEDTMDPVQEMSSPEIIQFEKQPQTETGSKMDIESNKEQSEIFKGLYHSGISEDLKKRKRSSSVDEEEFILKPRKLFSSAKVSSDMEDGVFKADSRELGITECSFISSFESFTEDLKTKMMTRYKRMEVRAQDVLTASHQHVSSLMNRIQQSNFQKLDNFRKIVAHELSSLEAETEVLKELEKDTLDFWEAQTVKINEFCTNQKLRIEAMDRRINESLSVLQKKEEGTTDIKKSL
ncbi:synaptonemal complex protein 2-like [Leptodactylus fuscus]|uniref:synaptonemal complex protein 2-like n=1 Tax=Leptodactylus fuscus TaxID=238119 RepID=UPI003F4E6998